MTQKKPLLLVMLLFFTWHTKAQVQQGSIIAPQTQSTGNQLDPILIDRYEKVEIGLHFDETGLFSKEADRYAYEDIRGLLVDNQGNEREIHLFYTQDFQDNSLFRFDTLSSAIKDDAGDGPCHNSPFTGNKWQRQFSIHPWRLRFSVKDPGSYRLYIQEKAGTSWVNNSILHFIVGPKNHVGRVSFDPISGYLQNELSQTYFPIGQQEGYYWQYGNTFAGDFSDYPVTTVCRYREIIRRIKNDRGNFLRILLHPGGIDLEWEEAGNYTKYLYRAADLDQIIELCEQNGIYVQLAVYDHTPLHVKGDAYTWTDHPYNDSRTVLPFYNCFPSLKKWEQYRFFGPQGVNWAKRKIRYILARWGYSPYLMALELNSEVDNANNTHGAGPPYDCKAQIRREVSLWVSATSAYAKQLQDNVLITTGISKYTTADGRIFTGANIDYNIFHAYSLSRNYGFEINSLTKHMKEEFSKPVQLGEFGMTWGNMEIQQSGVSPADSTPCANQDVVLTNIHNGLWASSLSGSFMAGVPWWNNRLHANWINPHGWKHFEPLGTFFKKEKLVGYNWEHFQNDCECDPVPDFQGSGSDAAPCNPKENIVNKFTGVTYNSNYWQSLRGRYNKVKTSNDTHLEVFGMKREGKALGWVHYKDHFWFTTGKGPAHSREGISSNNPFDWDYSECGPLIWNNTDPNVYENGVLPFSNPSASYAGKNPQSESLQGETLTLEDMGCHGVYQIDWFYTWPGGDYDDSHSSVPQGANPKGGDGGIGAFSQSISSTRMPNGEVKLILPIPELKGIRARNVSPDLAPDYAFKATLISPIVTFNQERDLGPAEICQGLITDFQANVSVAGSQGVNLSYNWSISPAGLDILGSSTGYGILVEALNPGTYHITLTVTANANCGGQNSQESATYYHTVTVNPQPCSIIDPDFPQKTFKDSFVENPKIIPNPSSSGSHFIIDIPWQTDEQVEIIITDLRGQVVFKEKSRVGLKKVQLNQAAGIYLLNIRTRDHSWNGKIMIE